jgi:hypothetical protein
MHITDVASITDCRCDISLIVSGYFFISALLWLRLSISLLNVMNHKVALKLKEICLRRENFFYRVPRMRED